MAQRDRSQGFAFVYVDVAQLLQQRDEIARQMDGPVLTKSPTVNFNKDKKRSEETQEMARPTAEEARESMDRLQALHHKLHAMLEEMDKVTGAKRRKS